MIDTIVSVVGIVAVVGIGFGCYAVACISPPVTKWLDMARPKESDQPEGNSYGITGNYRIAASDGPALDTWTQAEMDSADHAAKERFEKLRPIFEADNGPVESGPALKCPNSFCENGRITGNELAPNGSARRFDRPCPTCHREKP
jgi:hypothetical protein